jgi:RNA polymerase sigma-70 factor (ECF subfamily)
MSTYPVTAVIAQLAPMLTAERARPEVRNTVEIAALISAARAGSREAFGELVAQHESVVFRTALAALGRPEDAEDAAQDAFVVAWQKLAGYRGEASFRTWLLAITWRQALTRRRTRGRWWHRLGQPGDAHAAPALDAAVSPAPDPERAAVSADRASRAADAIKRLSPTLRDTLLLAAAGELSYPEIAVVLRVPLGTVKWRVAEARRQVERQLASDDRIDTSRRPAR